MALLQLRTLTHAHTQEGGAMALCGAPHDDRSRRTLLELQGRAEVVAAVQVCSLVRVCVTCTTCEFVCVLVLV